MTDVDLVIRWNSTWPLLHFNKKIIIPCPVLSDAPWTKIFLINCSINFYLTRLLLLIKWPASQISPPLHPVQCLQMGAKLMFSSSQSLSLSLSLSNLHPFSVLIYFYRNIILSTLPAAVLRVDQFIMMIG